MSGLKAASLIGLGGWGYHLGGWWFVLLAAVVWVILDSVELVYRVWREPNARRRS
jgi:hypothetical protein